MNGCRRTYGATLGVAIFAALAAGAGAAQAGIVTQTFDYNFGNEKRTITVGPNGSHFNMTPPQIAKSFDFAQFDSSLGTLEAVTFALSTGGTRIGGLTHNNGGPGTISVNVTHRFGFEFGGGLLAEGSTTVGFQRQSVSPWNLGGMLYDGFSQNLNTVAALNQTIGFSAGQFAGFVGGGTLDLDVYSRNLFEEMSVTGDGLTATFFVGSCDPNCGNFGTTGPIHGTATLTYTYREATTAIPEPGAMALFGAGLAALGVVRRRRRSAR